LQTPPPPCPASDLGAACPGSHCCSSTAPAHTHMPAAHTVTHSHLGTC
jgi:hypothetical protein